MANVRLHTFSDLVQHCLDFMGGTPDGGNLRRARRAVLSAYREMPSLRPWTYYYQRGRITTVASQTDGTISYDHSGSANEREVTLTGATWPSWAALGTLIIDNVAYEVASRVSSTILILSSTSNPGTDVAMATEYTLYRDTYTLPGDFKSCDELVNMNSYLGVGYQHPSAWLSQKQIISSPGSPRAWTITADPNYFGVLAARFDPPPDDVYTFDFIYQRRPRNMAIYSYDTGTATTTNGSATLTGSGTAWTSNMVGAVVRIGANSTDAPTDLTGEFPATLERTIIAYTSATSLTMDSVADQALTGVKYQISDPVDVEEGAMLSFLLRECEMQTRLAQRTEATQEELARYSEAMWRAQEADNRSTERRVAGEATYYRPRLRDWPITLDP
jgi:hypothetical protein